MVRSRWFLVLLCSSMLLLWMPVGHANDPARYNQAFEQAIAQRNLPQAIEVHRQMLAALPDDPATVIVGARIMTLQNNITGAMTAYTELLKKHPNHVQATLWLAQIEFIQQPDKAIQRIDAALKVYPGADALQQLAASELLRLQRPQQALPYMQAWAAASDPNNGVMRYNELGKLYYQLNQPSQAADALRRALDFKYDQAIAASLVQLYDESERWGELQATIALLIERAPKQNRAQIAQQLAAQTVRAQAQLFAVTKPASAPNKALTAALEAFMASYKEVSPLFAGLHDGSANWMLQLSDRVGLVSGTLAQDWRLANAAIYFAEQGDLGSAYDAVSKLDDDSAKIVASLRIAALLAANNEASANYWRGFAEFHWHDLRLRGARAGESVSDFDRMMGAAVPPIYTLSQRVGGYYHRLLLKHWPQHPAVQTSWTAAERADIARAYAAAHEFNDALRWLDSEQLSPYELRDWVTALLAQQPVDEPSLVQLSDRMLAWQQQLGAGNSSAIQHELNQVLLQMARHFATPFPALSEKIVRQQQQLATSDSQLYTLLELAVELGQQDRATALLAKITTAETRERATTLMNSPRLFSDFLKARQFSQALAYLRAGKPTEVWEINFTRPLVTALIAEQNTTALHELLTQHQRVIDDEAQLTGWIALIEIAAKAGGDTATLVNALVAQQQHFTRFNDIKLTDAYFQTVSEMVHRFGSAEQRTQLAQRRYTQDSTLQAMLWGAVLAHYK